MYHVSTPRTWQRTPPRIPGPSRSGRCAPCRSRAMPGARPRRARRTPRASRARRYPGPGSPVRHRPARGASAPRRGLPGPNVPRRRAPAPDRPPAARARRGARTMFAHQERADAAPRRRDSRCRHHAIAGQGGHLRGGEQLEERSELPVQPRQRVERVVAVDGDRRRRVRQRPRRHGRRRPVLVLAQRAYLGAGHAPIMSTTCPRRLSGVDVHARLRHRALDGERRGRVPLGDGAGRGEGDGRPGDGRSTGRWAACPVLLPSAPL